jgi:putative endonuclease
MELMTSGKITLGKNAEDLAVDFLKRRGYRIVERNFRLRWGEIDIIGQDGDTLCFVEVKSRTSAEQGSPWEAVTFFKQRRLSRLALAYLKKRYGTLEHKARFDVIAVVFDKEERPSIEILKDAFEFCG